MILNRYKQMEAAAAGGGVRAGERMRRILRIGGVYRLVQSYRREGTGWETLKER
ncbi:MAG: hypothetical protein ACLR3S_01525 [Clostridium fessum]